MSPRTTAALQRGDRVLYRAPDGGIRYAVVLRLLHRAGFKPSFMGTVLDGQLVGRLIEAYHYDVVAIEFTP
jgi:hypothetical protein